MLSGTEEIRRELLRRVDPVLVEVGDAGLGQECIVDEEAPRKFARRLAEHGVGRVGEDFRLARLPYHGVAAEQILDRGGGDDRARP